MMIEVALAVAVVALLCICTYIWEHDLRKYAKIPMATPRTIFAGNALSLDMARCHMVLADWAKSFGPVFRIRVFNEEILVLNNFESIHDALVTKGHTFAGRPPMYRTSKSDRNKHSIVWQTYTENLQFLRKEVLKSLKMYGDGKDNLELKCIPEIETMVDRLRCHDGESFDPVDPVYDAVSNVMLGLTLDKTFDHASSSFQMIKSINRLFNDTFGSGSARYMDFLPWLSKLGYFKHSARLDTALQLRDEFWEKELKFLKARGEDIDCIVQKLLALQSHPKGQRLGVEDLTAKECFTNLILAGTDTTATALTCLLLIFLHNPRVQEKMWEELKECIGENRLATLSDREHLPYCQAVLMELLRYTSHVPLAVPHFTTCDTSVLNIAVPANMTVYINLWALHHDPKDWEDPWAFKPERFLDSEGHLLPINHPIRRKLMVFGAGRRVCLGETLAKNRLFLFAAALVQNFEFLPSAEDIAKNELPPADPRTYEMGLVLHPKRFRLRAIPRC